MKRVPRQVDCPTELALELLGGKWKTVILARLKDGPLRYGELRRLIPRLSDKVLTQRLADLQERGLVAREATAGDAARYRLTPQAQALRPLLQQLYDWGEVQALRLGVRVAARAEEAAEA
jgi:DNA-binding HxlR family transcriptional regulator